MPQLKNIGGQAILEGVMMRGPEMMAIAVRRADGSILVKDGTWVPLVKRIPVLRWPFLRGAVVMVEAMINGMQALSFSADVAAADQERADEAARGEPASPPGEDDDRRPGGLGSASIALSLGAAMLLGVGLFVYVPHFVSGVGLNLLTGVPPLDDPDLGDPRFHLLTGLVKVTVFVGYIALITSMKDIRRVFQYHGAEHKSIYTWEAGEPLDVEHARRHSRLHPRCGTAFLAFVILVAIALFAAVFPLLPFLDDLQGWRRFVAGASIKIPMLFPIAGISYEFIRWAGKVRDNPVLRVLSYPGLAMQWLTTREPDAQQLEVALASLIRTLQREGAIEDAPYPAGVVLRAGEAEP